MEQHIGTRIKVFREEMGLTQSDLYRATGVKQTTLSSIESGTEPKSGIIAALLAAYPDLNPDWLLTGAGPMLRDGRALSPAPVAAAVAPVAQRAADLVAENTRVLHSEDFVQAARLLAENEFLKQTILQQNQQIASLQSTVERLLDALPLGKFQPDSYAAEAAPLYPTTPTQSAGFRYGKQDEPEAFAPMSVDGRLYGGLHGDLLSVVGESQADAA